jgi:hypothetical protein
MSDEADRIEALARLGTRSAPLGVRRRILATATAPAAGRRRARARSVVLGGALVLGAGAAMALASMPRGEDAPPAVEAQSAPPAASRSAPPAPESRSAGPAVATPAVATPPAPDAPEEAPIRDAQRLFTADGPRAEIERLLEGYLSAHPRGLYREEARYYLFLVAVRERDDARATLAAESFLAEFSAGHRADRVRAWRAHKP